MIRFFQRSLFLLLALTLLSCRPGPAVKRTAAAVPTLDHPPLTLPALLSTTIPTPPKATAIWPSPTAEAVGPTVTRTPSPPSPVPPPTPSPTPTTGPTYPIYEGPAIDRNDFGIQIHLHREDQLLILEQLKALDAGWVKVQVSWKIYQPESDRFDDFRFEELDRFVAAASANDVQVLLSVAKAPEWSRPTTEQDGPPSDFALFEAFMRTLAGRYKGQVTAYELWNEPNLQREWNGALLSGSATAALVRAGASGVRAVDPEAELISPAPAPTGINDGLIAIDDRLFLRQMIAAGVGDVVDAIGVHPYGWANPPDSSAAAPDPVAPSHNDHPSFFFGDTLVDYKGILEGAGLGEVPLWATEFGWGSYAGLGVPAPTGVEYMDAVDEQQQAAYTIRAYELAGEWAWVGPLFLWNLNFGPTLGEDHVASAYSILRPDGSRRPLFYSLTTLTKGG